VFKGVNEFNIALIELSNLVSAIENKNAGINVPNNAVKAMYFHFCLGIYFNELNPIERRNNPAKIILKAPNWKGVNPTNPRFIRINELPHINANSNKKNHLVCLEFIVVIYSANL
jgi:hypothetical protein